MVGRAILAIFALFLLAVTAFAVYWAVDIFLDGSASVSISRGRTRVRLGGWHAYLYGVGAVCAAAWLGLSGAALLMLALGRTPMLAWRMLKLARVAMVAAAAFCFIAVVAKVF